MSNKYIRSVLKYIIILIICLIVIFPMYRLFITSLSKRSELYEFPPKFLPDFTTTSYTDVLRDFPILRWMGNTTIVSASTSFISIILASFAAYSLSRFRFKGRWSTLIMLLITQMIPGTLLIVPIYLIFIKMNLLDNLLGLIIAYSTFSLPYCIWMLKGYFDSISIELDEAAMIDGCSRPRLLFTIIFPLALPGIAATALFSFIMGWDEFLLAKVLLSTRGNWVVSVGISSFNGQYGVYQDQIAAAGVLISLPVLILFFYLQRFFVSGLTQGSIKG